MNDRRKADRVRILSPGTILFGGNEVACTVRDLSSNGACLVVPTTCGLPALFQLAVANQRPKSCEVQWREETMLGISFR
jgi:hypothetical protein